MYIKKQIKNLDNNNMGLKQSKSCATENMKQIKASGIEEKTRTDILLFNTVKDVVERVEKLDKIYYKLPVQICNFSLIYLMILFYMMSLTMLQYF